MIQNPSFVAREYIQDDEVLNGRLADEFGGDNYCISANALYLGLTRGDDGCSHYICGEQEPTTGDDETDEEGEYENYYDGDEFADTADVASAVQSAMELAEFFRAQKKAEEQKAEVEVVEKLSRRPARTGYYTVNTYRPWVRRKNGRSLGHRGTIGPLDRDRLEFHPVAVVFDDNTTLRVA